MIRRNWKGKTSTVLAILMGTSLLMGGQAYAANEKSSITHKQHKQHKKHTQVKKKLHQQDQQEEAQLDNQSSDQENYNDNAWKSDSGVSTALDKQSNSLVATPTGKKASVGSNVADQVISNGLKYKGTPYKFGSSKNTTGTFDCSSFTQRVFKEAGITLPRDSRQQSRVGQQVSKNQLQKGDLIFFRSHGSSSPRITHVAIYAGNNTLLHTYGSPGVTTSKFFGTSWEKRFEIARRVTS
ncbi:hypothetical protein BRE01_58020 [Brevibacillus reuszeri]|uniref:NlpC/P60 domain-containing protein n=1 Tax=Brevibacillus reuszeri TaxID=54915 RepID=A0ABQ0TW82_9BACL|nr:C40 family peptidase [Brevibacillus reuszeri]MED1861180.1 C40 family peptidase [Brevibacillus reuszeri]GED72100.1 hypothetical protein BRE01_58020 [Brevibacillus reuszeri]